ncbi:MAG: type II secretion system protein N [Candidatus Electronema aureum]|uniref:Type II secretion system protein N n=1 Tax=Candidatus Electronema aureum TaxID=2005002 RepID=A0A521G0V5_9BACT|nr:MAG: type II secretion system protein N [Candidatus Electronema aureum]
MQMKQMLPGRGFCGYLIYTVAVLLLMLWLQFPAAAVKAKAEAELNQLTPGLEWQIGTIGLTLPADIRFGQIKVSGKGEKEPLVRAESLTLRPDFFNWRSWSALYRLQLLGGSVSGRLGLSKDRSGLEYSGELQGIRFDSPDFKKLLEGYDRTVSGTLSGNFTGRSAGQQGLFAELQGSFKVGKGAISLQAPVLGMDQIAFETISSTIKRRAGAVQIEGGKLESRLLAAEFSGDLRLTEPVASSSIRLKVSLNPRPELMASVGSPMLINLLKGQLKNDKLPFTVTGTLNAPGIVFNGLPADFNQQLQGRSGQP